MTGESPRESLRPSSGFPAAFRAASREALPFAILAGASALAIAFAPPDTRASGARLAILALGILAVWRVLGRSAADTASSPEGFETEHLVLPAMPAEISGMRAIETDLRMSSVSAFGVELRLKPVLRELAAWRLAANHGIEMDVAPDAARRILGEHLWHLVRAAETRPEVREPGVPLADVQAAIDRLERI